MWADLHTLWPVFKEEEIGKDRGESGASITSNGQKRRLPFWQGSSLLSIRCLNDGVLSDIYSFCTVAACKLTFKMH